MKPPNTKHAIIRIVDSSSQKIGHYLVRILREKVKVSIRERFWVLLRKCCYLYVSIGHLWSYQRHILASQLTLHISINRYLQLSFGGGGTWHFGTLPLSKARDTRVCQNNCWQGAASQLSTTAWSPGKHGMYFYQLSRHLCWESPLVCKENPDFIILIFKYVYLSSVTNVELPR